MATVSDVLETVLSLKNVSGYVAGMSKASDATRKLADQQVKSFGGDGSVAGAGPAQATNGVNSLTNALLALGRAGLIVNTLHAAFNTFVDDEKVIRRLAIQMKNLGQAGGVQGVLDFAQSLSGVTGIDDEAIAGVIARLQSFGVSTQQAFRLAEPILNISEDFGDSLDTVAEAFGRANIGVARGLRNYGILIAQGVKGTQALEQALQQADARSRGLARSSLDSVGGSARALQTAWENMLSAFTRLFGPILTGVFRFITQSLQGWALFFEKIADFLGIRAPQDLSGVGGPGGASQGLATEATLRRLADGVDDLGDKLVRRVLGGPGTIAARAGNLRDYQIAFGN